MQKLSSMILKNTFHFKYPYSFIKANGFFPCLRPSICSSTLPRQKLTSLLLRMQNKPFHPKPHFLAYNQHWRCCHSFQLIPGCTWHLLGHRWGSLSLASKEHVEILKQAWLPASHPVLIVYIATVKISVTFDLIWKPFLTCTQNLAIVLSSTVSLLETREPDMDKLNFSSNKLCDPDRTRWLHGCFWNWKDYSTA